MANKSFKISGQLDVSNIISNTEKLKNALKSSLDTASFQKIEKEFDKLAQAQAAYQQAMKSSFANQSDVKAANKAIADFQKTYAKLSSTVQATLNTKGINISGDLAKGFEKERKEIEAEKQKLAKAAKEWKTQIQNALTGSSLSKGDQQALARSIFSEEEFKKQIERIKKESEKTFSDMEKKKAGLTSKQKEITSYTDEQKRQTFLSASQQIEYGKLQSKKGAKETALSQQRSDLEKLEKEYNDTQKAYEQRIEGLRNLESALQQERMLAANAAQEEAQYRQQHPGATTRNDAELNRLANQTKIRRAAVQGAQAELNKNAKGDTVKSLEEDRKKSEQKLNILRTSITNLEAEIKSLTTQTNTLDQIARDNADKSLSDIKTQLAALEQRLKEADPEKSPQNQQLQDLERSYNAVHSIDENTEALKQREQALNEQIDAARRAAVENSGLTETLEETSEAIRENTEESQKNVNEMDELIDSQNKVDEAFDNMKNSIKTFLSIGSAIGGLRRVLQDTFNDVKELDKSFANIAMVTDYTVGQMWESYGQYAEMANELGQSTKSVIEASGLFYQQGLDTAESLALTEDTMKLATLAGFDFSEATSQMTAALRGFKMEMDEGARVTDVYSQLAAKAAADVEGISYAMTKTASIAASAGMEFETTSAFLTQMIETTQEAPANIGTAMKTIIARFTELKENVAGTEDSEFDDLDYNKVDIALKSVGVSIKDANGQFRNLDEVFLELSSKWSTLDRNTQRYIATIAAGSRQQSRFIAMMDNYDRTIELVDTAYNSAGKSGEQFAKYQDTLEYKLNKLQNTWEQFRTSFFNSEFFKNIIDGLNKILGKINDFNAFDIISLGTTWLTFGRLMITNMIKGIQDGTRLISNALTPVFEKMRTSIQSFLNTKFNIGIGVNVNELKQQLAIAQERYKNAQKKIEDNTIIIDVDTALALQELENLENKYEALLQEALDAGRTDSEAIEWANTNMSDEERQQMSRGRAARNAQEQRAQGEAELQAAQDTINQYTGNIEEVEAASQARGQFIGQTIGSAITLGITAITTQEDPMSAVGTVLIGGLTAMIPAVVSAAVSMGTSLTAGFVASTLGIGAIILAITAAITGIAVGIKKYFNDKEAKKAENQVKQIEKQIKNLDESINDTKNSLAELKETSETLEDISSAWEKLGNKTVKTTEEQTQYNEMIEAIKEQYPELITYYNEETNQIQLSIDLLNQKVEAQKTLVEEEQKLLNLQMSEKRVAQRNLQKQQFAVASNAEDGIFEGSLKIQEVSDLEQLLQEAGNYTREDFEQMLKYEVQQNIPGYWENAAIGAALSKHSENWYEGYVDSQGKYFDSTSIISMVGAEANLQRALSAGEITEQELSKYRNTFNYSEEVISEFSAAVAEYNADLAEIDKQLNGFNIQEQAASNNEMISQQLGEGFESASSVLSYQAARIQSHIQSGTRNDRRDNAITSLESMGYDTSLINRADFSAFLKDATSGVAGSKWSRLDESSKVLAKELGYDIDSWNEEIDKASDDEEVKEKLRAKYDAYLEAQVNEILAQNEDQAEEIQEALNYFYANASNMTVDEIKTQSEEFAQEFGLEVEDMNKIMNVSGFESALDNAMTTGIKNLDSLYSSTIQTFSATLDAASLSNNQRAALGNAINDVITGYKLSKDEINQLLQVDLSQGYHQIQSNSETYIQALMGAGLSLENATEVFESYINNIGLVLGKGVFGEAGAQVIKEQLQVDIKGFKSQYEPLIEARNEMLENEGAISSDTYFSLIEAGFEDYVKITTSGYELIADKAEEAWTAQAMAPLEVLREDIKLNKQLLNDAQKMSEEDWTVTYWKGNSDMSISSVDSAIFQYIENEKKFEGATEQLTDAQKKYIEAIVAAGYTTEKEYIKALQEGTAALENMEPDTWIQGLINLQEASSEAAEKVNDLKDELADLEEQLIEDKEAVDEAAQALHEAKFGTEDFQSGLDGLINYERPLELINKQLENLKENLTDVFSVEDASTAMNQIAGLYEDKMATLQAEGKVIDQSLANIRQELLANYGNYISFDENGLAKVDFSYEDMQNSDIIKTDGLEKLIEEYNSTYDMALDKEQEYLDAQKEFDELKSEARDKYITMEQNVIDIIKEQMQEEIDAVTDKYAALEEADNNYLDALQEAIDKQRKLRDQENQYEDLATKEKKLALMQRDTSGANRKEVISLEQEIEDDRQNLLDNEIDNLIDSMKELYDKQKEARELEIEAMEAATENMQLINETALNIISGFTNVEDYQSWLLENNPSVKDMTVAQTEQYLEEAKEDFAGYAQYVSLTTEEIKLKTDEINQKADEMFTNTSENITDIGTVIQDAAEKAKQEAIDDAQEAYDKAIEKMDETQKKITETKDALDKAEDAAVIAHGAAMDEMVKASESAMLKVATAGAEMLIEAETLDLSNSEEVQKFAKTHNFYNEKTGEYSRGFVDALTNKGYDTSSMVVDKRWQITGIPINGGPTIYLSGKFDTKAEAEAVLPKYLNEYSNILKNITVTPVIGSEVTGAYKKYAEGGLVNYTGPAWVDGTPQKPESFLSAEDTARIGAAAKLLADLPIFNTTSNAENAVSTNIGDTSIEIHINVENISDDYDVDQMIERVKQDIVDVAKPIGASVILNK